MEGPQHLAPMGAGVEEVQRACVTLETQAHLLPSLGVTDLPQVPGLFGSVLGHLKRCDYGVVGGQSIWVHITVPWERGLENWVTQHKTYFLHKTIIKGLCYTGHQDLIF